MHIHFSNWIRTLLFQYSNQEDATAIYQIKSRLFGTYWVSYWLPLLLFLSSQLLWIKKLREIHLIRIVIALSLIAPMQSFLIALTTVHRDYLPSTWTISISSRIIEWLFSIGIFGLTALAFHLVKLRFKRLKDV